MLDTREKLTEESHDSYVTKCILLIIPITLLYYPGRVTRVIQTKHTFMPKYTYC